MGAGIYELAQEAVSRSGLCTQPATRCKERNGDQGCLEKQSGKQGLERDSRPGLGGPSPGGGDLVPESQSGGAQVGTAQELLESGSRASSWQSREGEEVTDGRGCSSQPPPARGSQDDLVYQCPRKGGGQGVGGTGRAWAAVGDGSLRRSSSSPHPRNLFPTGAPPLSTHGNPP